MAAFTRIKDISDLLRISLCFLASFVVLLAGYVAYRLNGVQTNNFVPQDFFSFILQNEIVPLEGILVGIIVPFLLIAGTHVINDYFDYENDVINKRLDRPLVRGSISTRTALTLALSFYIIALAITIIETLLWLPIHFIVATVLFILLGIGYNFGVKKYGIIGNIWVSMGYIMPFLMGTFIVGLVNEWVILNVIVLCFFIFFLALGREVLKDIMDIDGDKMTGKKSIAVVFGAHWAAKISGLIYILSILCGCSLFLFLGFKNNIIFIIGFLIVIVLLLRTSYLLNKNPSLEIAIKGRKYSRWSLWWSTALILVSSLFI
ncbi:MAG: UbiA family prenyltransferase [Candidatus Hodarchaeota archaeon]